jgi:predicted naringenin-chalcone synthase
MHPSVYIVNTLTVLPPRYEATDLAKRVFDSNRVGERTHKLATRVASRFGIEARTSVLDLDRFPAMQLLDDSQSPLAWGKQIIEGLTHDFDIDEIGHLSVAYNAAPEQDNLPNLASKLVQDLNLKVDSPPMELPNYGCAAGIYAIESAVKYCQSHDRAALVYVFDQCSWWAKPNLMERNEHFAELLTSMLLFADGAVGLLILPERLKAKHDGPSLRIDSLDTYYESGNLISMDKGCFLINKDLKNHIPEVVANKMVKPVMEREALETDDIKEWSIHQGGTAILRRFGEEQVLGLPEEALERSQKLFNRYGNFSAPSCLFVLDSFFHKPEPDTKTGDRGVVVGFGAGYYLGMLTYTRL